MDAYLFWQLASLAQSDPTHSQSDLKSIYSCLLLLSLLLKYHYYHLCHLFIYINFLSGLLCCDSPCGVVIVLVDSAFDIHLLILYDYHVNKNEK